MKKLLTYFLCISFLLSVNGFHVMIAEAKSKALPLGEMVSRGTVKFETRENVWKSVESSHFPIFQGVKIKTENGMAFISLSNGGLIEVRQNSHFFLTEQGHFNLLQGGIEFRIPSGSELNFKVGKVSLSSPKVMQASRVPLSNIPTNEETIGSLQIHSNGALNIKMVKGKLSVFDENQVILAGLSSNESITLPSSLIRSSPKTMVAQVGETAGGTGATGGFLGLSTWTWVGIAAVAVAVGAIAGVAASQGDDDHDWIPLCP